VEAISRWRDDPSHDEVYFDECETLLGEISAEEPERLIPVGVEAAERIERYPEIAIDITLKLCGSAVEAARGLGCVMIARIGRYNPRTWVALIKQLAEDDSQGVRDLAARIFDHGTTLEGWVSMHREFVFEILGEWVGDKSYRVRRLTTRALAGFASISSGNAKHVFELLTPLFEDPAEFVRRNFASFLREVGRRQPESVFEFLEARVEQRSANCSELIPMILDASFASRFSERRRSLLVRISN
jgi:hypothetical protein